MGGMGKPGNQNTWVYDAVRDVWFGGSTGGSSQILIQDVSGSVLGPDLLVTVLQAQSGAIGFDIAGNAWGHWNETTGGDQSAYTSWFLGTNGTATDFTALTLGKANLNLAGDGHPINPKSLSFSIGSQGDYLQYLAMGARSASSHAGYHTFGVPGQQQSFIIQGTDGASKANVIIFSTIPSAFDHLYGGRGVIFIGNADHTPTGGGNPPQLGGLLYVIAGELYWMDEAGTQYQLTPNSNSGSIYANVSASYIVASGGNANPNNRIITGSGGTSIIDHGAGSTLTVSSSVAADLFATYLIVSGNSFNPNYRKLAAGTGITLVDNGAANTLVINVSSSGGTVTSISGAGGSTVTSVGGAYTVSSSIYANVSASYLVIAADSYNPNERRLVAGAGVTFVDSGVGGTLTVTTSGSTQGGKSVPLYSIPILAGTVTSNTSFSSSKQTLGMCYFDPTIITGFSASMAHYYFRVAIDVFTSELNLSGAVDLNDYNGICAFTPTSVVGSIMSTSSGNTIQLQADLTSVLSTVTGSGFFEARLWRTVSGTTNSSTTCRNARLDVVLT